MYGYYQAPQYPMRQEVVRVTGEPGARAYMLAPNSSALLLDETAPVVWFVAADGAGYKTVTPYRIEPMKQEAPADMKTLEERIRKLEELYESDHKTDDGQ